MLNTLNIKKIVYGSFGVFVTLYFLSAFLSPVDQQTLDTYHISEFVMRLILVSVFIPLVVIWACAAYGFVHFKQYSLSIKGTPYGKGINTLANGLGIIVLQQLVSGMLSVVASIAVIKGALGGDTGIQVISSALDIGFSLAAILVVYQGARQLTGLLSKNKRLPLQSSSFYLLTAVSIGYIASVAICYVNGPPANSIYSHLSLGGTLALIVLPYIVTWNLAV